MQHEMDPLSEADLQMERALLPKKHIGPVPGEKNDGDAWTGFEWVRPERYEALRATTMPGLPPLQPVAELRELAMAADVLHGAPAPPAAPTVPPPCPPAAVEAARAPLPTAKPYRGSALHRANIQDAVGQLLIELDDKPERGGLAETPERAAKAWQHWTQGYGMDPAAVLKCFEDGAQGCDEMVVVAGIPIYSHCEHHLAPIFGTATIAYLPDKRIVGLSKLPRLADIFARRLQVQERMTNQIAEAIMEHLKPLGCGVVIKARHLCMESRGIQVAGTHTTTSALRGAFREDARVRAEFFTLAHGG